MSWYRNWFADELYMDLYAHRDGSEARQAVDLFERIAGNAEPDRQVLDLACGSGRHTFELARRGHRVAAADLSPTLLAAARRKTRRHAEHVALVRSDMRRLPFRDGSFGAVLQLFTAFGYFRSDKENAAVIGQVRGTLASGGWYMLDFLNSAQLRAQLVPESDQRIGDIRVMQERRISDDRVEKRIRVIRGGRERIFRESVRLFTLDDFRRMFQQHHLSLKHIFGDYTGAAFESSSPRCLMFAQAE